jgi:hypothetical protein
MMPRELPARPNLEQLKKQAKSLLHAAQARDGDALRRFAVLPALSGKSIKEIDAADLALHDAQSVIARDDCITLFTIAIPATMADTKHSEGLKLARLLMVLSGMSPLFILWAIKGNKIVPDGYLLGVCATLVLIPNLG